MQEGREQNGEAAEPTKEVGDLDHKEIANTQGILFADKVGWIADMRALFATSYDGVYLPLLSNWKRPYFLTKRKREQLLTRDASIKEHTSKEERASANNEPRKKKRKIVSIKEETNTLRTAEQVHSTIQRIVGEAYQHLYQAFLSCKGNN